MPIYPYSNKTKDYCCMDILAYFIIRCSYLCNFGKHEIGLIIRINRGKWAQPHSQGVLASESVYIKKIINFINDIWRQYVDPSCDETLYV